MPNLTLSVPDISCDHCKTSIEGAVGVLDTVAGVEVSISDRAVSIVFKDEIDLAGVTSAIEDQGYEVEPVVNQ